MLLFLWHHLHWSFFTLALFTIVHDDSVLHSFLLLFLPVLSFETRYNILAANSFPPLVYTVTILLCKTTRATCFISGQLPAGSLSSRRNHRREIFLQGTENADALESIEALRDVIDARLKATEQAVCHFSSELNILNSYMDVKLQFDFVVNEVQMYTSYLDLAYIY